MCVRQTRWYAYHMLSNISTKATIDGAVVGVFWFVQSIFQCVTRSIIAIIIFHRVILFDSKQVFHEWKKKHKKKQQQKFKKWRENFEKIYYMPLTNFHWIERNKKKPKENCSTNLQDMSALGHEYLWASKRERHTHTANDKLQ